MLIILANVALFLIFAKENAKKFGRVLRLLLFSEKIF